MIQKPLLSVGILCANKRLHLHGQPCPNYWILLAIHLGGVKSEGLNCEALVSHWIVGCTAQGGREDCCIQVHSPASLW